MIKHIIISVLLLSLVSCKTPLPTSTLKKTALFDGISLNGLKNYGKEKWYVDNNLLICENGKDGAFGYLATEKKYKDFELTLEFKKTLKSNGGVFIHSNIEDTKIEGWQVEIAVPTHFTGGIHEYERGWLVKPALEKDKVIKLDDWNTMKILVKGKELTTWLNGTEMANIIDKKLATTNGKIAFQIHKGDVTKIQWRNIFITEL